MLLTRISAFFTAIIIFLGSIPVKFFPKVTQAPSADELLAMEDIIDKYEIADEIYAVNIGGKSADERNMLMCLQGLVAKTKPQIYLFSGGIYKTYLDEIEASGKKIIYNDENGTPWAAKTLIEKFSSYISDGGYVLYSDSEFAEGLNAATNFAIAKGWLPAAESMKETVEECGLVLKKDLTEEKYDYAFQRKYFNELRDSFNKKAVVHIKAEQIALRDLAIQQGYYCFYTGVDEAGKKYFREILKSFGANTAVFGWVEQEKHCVAEASKMGCWVNPADWCTNNSILSSFGKDNIQPMSNEGKAYSDESKHYICLLFSDGDNCQWIQNGYSEFFETRRKYPDSNISWTFSPMVREFCPLMFEKVRKASDENNYPICGPSGAGYVLPSTYDPKALDGFSKLTASQMLKSGQRIYNCIDDYTVFGDARTQYALSWFSRFDNIDGGLLYLDPGKYLAGGGKVWFCDDKPFVSTRLSLWADEGYDGATDEWIKEKADTVNNYPVDIHSINGYSLVCIHAWTMKPDSIAKFIGMLDDHVVLLSAADFIATVGKNIPHKNAKPQ